MDKQIPVRSPGLHKRSLSSGLFSKRLLKFAAGVALVLALLRFYPHEALSKRIPLSTAVWSSDGELLRVTLASDEQYRLWTPLSEISPDVANAFLLKEDRWFRWHSG